MAVGHEKRLYRAAQVKRKAAPKPGDARPLPPASFAEVSFSTRFEPAHELAAWVRRTFIEEGGALFNPEHKHLADASIGWLWASDGYAKQGRRVLGLTERVQSMGNPWAKARAEQQLAQWFGEVPEFLITLDGFHCATCSDADFCALVEHEMMHIAQATDEFGAPKWRKDGRPALSIRGHDVEEFVGIVRRYGVGDLDGGVARLVIAAAGGATVAPASVASACGTCMAKA